MFDEICSSNNVQIQKYQKDQRWFLKYFLLKKDMMIISQRIGSYDKSGGIATPFLISSTWINLVISCQEDDGST